METLTNNRNVNVFGRKTRNWRPGWWPGSRDPESTFDDRHESEPLAEEMEGDDSQRARRVLRRISSLQGECRTEEIPNAFLQFARG